MYVCANAWACFDCYYHYYDRTLLVGSAAEPFCLHQFELLSYTTHPVELVYKISYHIHFLSLSLLFNREIRIGFLNSLDFFLFGTFKFIINTFTFTITCANSKCLKRINQTHIDKNIIISHRDPFTNTIDLYFIARFFLYMCYVQLVLFWFCFSSFFYRYIVRVFLLSIFFYDDVYSIAIFFSIALNSWNVSFYCCFWYKKAKNKNDEHKYFDESRLCHKKRLT